MGNSEVDAACAELKQLVLVSGKPAGGLVEMAETWVRNGWVTDQAEVLSDGIAITDKGRAAVAARKRM